MDEYTRQELIERIKARNKVAESDQKPSVPAADTMAQSPIIR